MQPLIAKYVKEYHQHQGSPTDKVKSILMHYANNWVWAGTSSLVTDLIDDNNITADDIVDFLVRSYEDEGGNDEFHYAVRALQICLRKAHLANVHSTHDEEFVEDDSNDEDGIDSSFQNYLGKSHPTFRGSI